MDSLELFKICIKYVDNKFNRLEYRNYIISMGGYKYLSEIFLFIY